MKTFGKVVLWIFAVFGFLMLIFIIWIWRSFPAKKEVKILDNTYLELNLSGMHYDYNEYDNVFFIKEEMSIGDICRKIDNAMIDPRIKGIILKPQIYFGGWALTKELRDKLIEFRESGKELYAYINMTYDKGYYLASPAQKIYLNPSSTAGIVLAGIGVELNYYEGLLEKIGLDVTVLHAGKYKGSGETFDRRTMTPGMKTNIDIMLDGLFQTYTVDLQSSRNLSPAKIDSIFNQRSEYFISGIQALEMNLVDYLGDEEKFTCEIIGDNPVVNITDYPADLQRYSYDKIAVLYAQGGITFSEAGMFDSDYRRITEQKTIHQLERIEKMRSVKGLVLRVDSGGGSALVSDIILKKLEQLNEKIPVVISMGNVAASGGYWISSQADYIFAQPNTITGSIGVVSMIPNWQSLRQWAEVNTYQLKRGKYALFFSPNFTPSNEDIAILQNDMNTLYLEFKDLVAHGRHLPLTEVEEIAQGRIWTGLQAVENGLIDELGGLDDAIRKAAELASLDEYGTLILPEKKTLIDILLKSDLGISAVTLLKLYAGDLEVPFVKQFDEGAELLKSSLNDPFQLRMPYQLTIQ